MKTTFKKSLLASATCLAGGATALFATPAFAQDAPQDAEAEAPGGSIIVTGSLIRNPNLDQANPVNVTTADQIELKQSNVAEEVLRELPGIVPNVGSAVNNGNGGFSYVDLRGLGANRNIVLLDGNRIVPAGPEGQVDLNNIPLALLSRVDALTGAAVTTYGADAITGVVNFVTRKDFSGVELSASQQITEEGDGNFFRADLTIGANFDDGRGNAVLSIGYQDSDPVFQGDRDFSRDSISSYSGGVAGSGLAPVPSRFFGTRGIDAATGLPSIDPTVENGAFRQIDPATGTAIKNFATFNFNPFNLLQAPFQRYNIFAQANYEVSDAVEVYTRGLFSKNRVNTIVAPSGAFDLPVTINLNNPLLPANLRRQFCALDIDPRDAVYQARFSVAQCDAGAAAAGAGSVGYGVIGVGNVVPTSTLIAGGFDVDLDGDIDAQDTVDTNPAILLRRRSVEIGVRISDYTSTVFDYRIGARGAITDAIDWDVTGAYGESDQIQRVTGYALKSRFVQGLLVNGTAANPVCQDTSNGCVPVNVFGAAGTISPAAADFLSESSTVTTRTSLAQVRGVISGDLLTLGTASEPIGFALGGEYRNYGAQQISDSLAKSGDLGGFGTAPPDIDGGYDVYEGYGEIIAPIFDMLTVEGGARYSQYKVTGGGSANTFTYKVGATFEPFDGLKFRGNYAKAVRAPNVFELFNPPTTELTNLGVDPCSGTAPTTNANLRAVCIAQGAPAATIGTIENPAAAQANITTSGSLNLDPEKAKTYTFGAVFQPDFIPRFSMSVDYYHIKVTDVVGAPLPGDLIGACFGTITAASATDPNCTIIRRNRISGGLDGDTTTVPGLFAPLTNQGKLLTDGVDLIANYSTDLGFGNLALSFVGNWTNRSKFQATPTSLNRECVGYYSVNCSFTGSIQPKFQFSQRSTLSIKDVDISLLWRWIDGNSFEPQQLADDRAVADGKNRDAAGVPLPIDLDQIGEDGFQGCPNFETTDEGGCLVEEGFRRIGAEHYFDLTLRFNASDNLTFTATVQNLFDNQPKVVGNSIGSTTFNSGNTYPSTYDSLGRRYAVSAKLKF